MPLYLCKLSYFFCLLLFSLLPFAGTAQEKELESIPNQPSPEAYDLLKDSKGYIWVAHDHGVSRYDGLKFITLRNPRQNSISMTGLVEDKQGRIWCHNFSGQIFYIQNLQLHLLEDYKYEQEQGFPRITICGDELVATSVKGLFVHNLVTGKSAYHLIPNGTTSLVSVGNRVVMYGASGWYSYTQGKKPTRLFINAAIPHDYANSLQPKSLKDTFYLISNPVGRYYTLTLKGNVVNVHASYSTKSFINTISVNKEQVWVNTTQQSFTTDGRERISGMSISDLLSDHQGNRWISSTKRGLCVQYNVQHTEKLNDSLFKAGSDVRTMLAEGNAMFWATAGGVLYKTDTASLPEHLISIPKEEGALEKIASLGNGQLLLAASLGLYRYNYTSGILKKLPVGITVKDIAISQENVYFATTTGITVFSREAIQSPTPGGPLKTELGGKKTRSRSLALLGDSLIIAYSDGVYVFSDNKLRPLLFRQKPVYATVVRTVDSKVLIGTFTQGLLVLDNGTLRSLTEKEGLASNFIKNIKILGGTTWLIFADRFQPLNATLTATEDQILPFSKGGINDFTALGNQLYIAISGVYTMQMKRPSSGILSKTYIDNITVNGGGPVTGNKLKHYQNHLQFQVSTPYFSPYREITYQYRIKHTTNSEWQQGAPGQTAFNVVALEPGAYDFEIVATDENRKPISEPARYHFEIMPPWYQHWAFKTLAVLLAIASVGGGIRLYYQSRLRQQRRAYERQLDIQAERHRISAEIHDDIGAGLLAMRLLTEMTRNKLPEGEASREVGKIHASITELSHKMREVIWSLNTDNDRLENLLFYIRRQAVSLFENSAITLKVEFPKHDIPPVIIHGQKRRHIYLAVKEALHNCLKHSEARNCLLRMYIQGSLLYISVTDDGKGFAALQKEDTGNGLPSMKKRMQQIEGVLEVETKEKTVVQFIIPLTKSL